MKKLSLIVCLLALLAATPSATYALRGADDDTPVILAPGTTILDPLLELDLRDYLTAAPPAATNIYAVSDVSNGDGGVYVSVVGLRPDLPDPYVWGLEDGNSVIWTGMIKKSGGQMQLYRPGVTACHDCKTLDGGPGGGSDIYFPWAAGKRMMMGPRGIHGAGDYGTSGMIAIDWVGGDDMNSAGPTVYASSSGSIDYVCHDTTHDKSTAVRITDGSTVILYAHLIYNSNLAGGHTFSRGQPIGQLKYGNFGTPSVGCGWAQQSANHYHLHWMIDPNGGKYRTESWTLTVNTATWQRGNEQVKTNMWMSGGSGSGGVVTPPGQGDSPDGCTTPPCPDDPGGNPGNPVIIDHDNPANLRLSGIHFWDYVIGGLNTIFVQVVLENFPESTVSQEGDQTWDLAVNMMATLIRDTNTILVNDTFNFSMVFIVMGMILGIEIFMRLIGVALLILTVIKRVPFIP